jgi:DNA polymerase-3 subunit delta
MGLMTPSKLIVVDKAQDFVKGDERRRLLERYAEHPAETSTLVLRGETWRKGKLDKLIEAGGGVVHKCMEAGEKQARGFAIARCQKRYDATLEPDAAALLVERTGTNLSRIDSEVAKLALAAGPGGTITRALVVELIGLSREEQVWSIQQAVLSGEPARALDKLHEFYETAQKPSDVDVPLSYSLMDLGRKLTFIAAAQEQGENTRAVAQSINLWGESERLVGAAARRAGLRAAARLFDRAVDGDARSKSGFGGFRATLPRLAVEICEQTAI